MDRNVPTVKLICRSGTDCQYWTCMEDLGELHYVLCMSVTRDRRSRTLSATQTKYLEGVLKRLIRKTASQYPLNPNREESLNHGGR